MSDVGFAAVPTFEGGFASLGVDEPVMEVDGVKEGGGPEFGRKARTIQKSTNLNCQSVVVYFRAVVL
jgi:hypothetical protein